MLETASERLSRARRPALRLARQGAGACASPPSRPPASARVPFTTGILIGIGETRRERIEALLALARPARRATATSRKSSSRTSAPSPARAWRSAPSRRSTSMLWTIAVARLIFGAGDEHPGAAQSAAPARCAQLIARRHQRLGRRLAGDARPRQSGGALAASRRCSSAPPSAPASTLVERLADLSRPIARRAPRRWIDAGAAAPPLLRRRRCRRACAAHGRAGRPGAAASPLPRDAARMRRPAPPSRRDRAASSTAPSPATRSTEARHRRAVRGARRRASPRSAAPPTSCARRVSGDAVTYVVNRNINYTNICTYRLHSSAPSPRASRSEDLRGRPYDLALDEIARRAREAWERGATEVCLQGGIHPSYTGETYLDDLPRGEGGGARHARARLLAARDLARRRNARACRSATSSPRSKTPGLGTLPGTAAEILDDEVRAVLCPDKINTAAVARGDARPRTRSACGRTATIMFGHVDGYRALGAASAAHARACRRETGGFTEFVPLPFVHMEAPIYLQGPGAPRARPSARPC